MNYLDLFHGIGGFALGAYWAGMKFEHHYCSDIEPWCQELYAKRFPDSIQLGDITKIDTSQLPAGDWIITGGFPCQDISIAGKGAGIHGERSGLWFEYWRLINDLRPRFAIMENVGMLVHRGLREVLGSLSEIGYNAEWQDIRASDVGAPHRRERIWIVAYPEHDGRNKTKKPRKYCRNESEKQAGAQHIVDEFEGIDLLRGKGFTGKTEDVAYPASDRRQWPGSGSATQEGLQPRSEHTGELESRPEGCGEDVADTGSIGQAERRDTGFQDITESGGLRTNNRVRTPINERGQWWSTEPDVGRLAHGVPRRVDRLRGLGNAIVPQIAELLFRQIIKNA